MRIATAKSCKSKSWRNIDISWNEFVQKLSEPTTLCPTLKGYLKLPISKQADIKDIGGYVGGYLKDGIRKATHLETRSILTLDIDSKPQEDLLDNLIKKGVEIVVHSTFKHTTEKPRYRIVVPLSKEVNPEQYEAIARKFADSLGIEQFDPTTFQPHRLMYWPGKPKDTEFVFNRYKGKLLDTDNVLSQYRNWCDSSEWPIHEAQDKVIKSKADKQQDPREKKGVVGSFCRTYTITEAIEEFLQDDYTTCDIADRYTYTKSETSAGLIVYEDTWAYSHHGSDPISGKLCNAFDLVRVHLFGHEDVNELEDKAPTQLPSYKLMQDLANNDSRVTQVMLEERKDAATASDFDTDDDIPVDWQTKLTKNIKTGDIDPTIQNITLILKCDEAFKGKLKYNEFDQFNYVHSSLEWRNIQKPVIFDDVDYAGVRAYMEMYYGIVSKTKIDDALALEFFRNKYHPVREYLDGLEWDGVTRLDTFLIDYFAAEDNTFTRAAVRKALTAAVQRIYHPGSKFDHMLILVGDQGSGKSEFGKRLCMADRMWFNDNFAISQKENKMEEQVRGVWITEMPEMAGFSKADVNTIKSFVTRTFDSYRAAFARTKTTYHRQGILIGTTNDLEFLRDSTGDRRYWPISIDKNKAEKNIFDATQGDIDQIWAEAKHRYLNGERLYLLADEEMEARKAQRSHTIRDDRQGIVEQYLGIPLSDNWKDKTLFERRSYLEDYKPDSDWTPNNGTYLREFVCTAEIWCECFGLEKSKMTRFDTQNINSILKSLTNWKFVNSTKRFGDYGPQKYYVREL